MVARTITYHNDNELVHAFALGDTAAEKQLFTQYFKPLTYYTEKIVNNIPQAEDIAIEVFLKLFERRKHFASIEAVRGFLYRSARNAAINIVSIEKNRERIKKQISDQAEKEENEGGLFDNDRLRAEVLFDIYREMENLPEKCGQIFKMIFIEEKSTDEVAQYFNINVQTVRSQKARAIQLLKTALSDKHKDAALLLIIAWALIQQGL